MKLIEPSVEIMYGPRPDLLQFIEKCGRVCYKSEERITDTSAEVFIKGIITRGHESVLEHAHITVRFITDRGVSHEIVRHRIASYSQESTRYCDYGGDDIQYINPGQDGEPGKIMQGVFLSLEVAYKALRALGVPPQIARAVLPNALKTEIIMTANLREWRLFFRLRTSAAAHPNMQQVACPLLAYLKNRIPIIFDDISGEPMTKLRLAKVTETI